MYTQALTMGASPVPASPSTKLLEGENHEDVLITVNIKSPWVLAKAADGPPLLPVCVCLTPRAFRVCVCVCVCVYVLARCSSATP